MADGRVTAADLLHAFQVAEQWLARNRDGINAINVYPVPDGDTGTNMLLTVRAALRDLPADPAHVGDLAAQLARGALLGARGNSGVIWSQMLRGFAEHLAGHEDTSIPDLAAALVNASDVSYAAVGQPVEGTMLTVLREAAHAAAQAAPQAAEAETGHATLMHALVDEAYRSVARTPDLLQRLKDAGVVDSGGAGVAVLLEGFALGLHRAPLPDAPRYTGAEQVQAGAVAHEGYGYCTEFVVAVPPERRPPDRGALERQLLAQGGESVLVVGDDRTVHVHVHLEDPGTAISLGVAAGSLISVKVENMQAQHEAWMDAQSEDPGAAKDAEGALPSVGLVAVARGAGIAAAFRDLGATRVVDAASKASAGELLEAARGAGRDHVILLPNDKDMQMAAEAAAREAEGFITVVPTQNAAAGLAAAVYYLPAGNPVDIRREILAALEGLHSVEVSTAVRDASVDGVDVRRGHAIAFLDGRLVATEGEPEGALMAALRHLLEDAPEAALELVTVYLGEGVPDAEGDRLATRIQDAYPDLEVEVLQGGQPHYPYLASIE